MLYDQAAGKGSVSILRLSQVSSLGIDHSCLVLLYNPKNLACKVAESTSSRLPANTAKKLPIMRGCNQNNNNALTFFVCFLYSAGRTTPTSKSLRYQIERGEIGKVRVVKTTSRDVPSAVYKEFLITSGSNFLTHCFLLE